MATAKQRVEHLPEVMSDEGGRLGRHLHHDPRSKNFPVRALLPKNVKPGHTTWFRRGVFDQGSTSSCEGQAIAGLILTSPNRAELTPGQLHGVDPLQLYYAAQKLDPWPGQEPDYLGTTTLAALKAAKDMGLIHEYRWGFGLDDVLATLTELGPVAIGINWYEGFDAPKSDGRLELSGDVRGGHALELTSINAAEKTVRGVNSWGIKWGDRGRFEMTWDLLDRLLHEDGEAGFAVIPPTKNP